MLRDLVKDAESRMDGAITSLRTDLGAFRTGRARPQLVEKLIVEMYGVEMQLNQMAVISVPEARQIAIRPYDVSSISAIERAILKSDLGIMPNNDGKIIRLNIPPLTEERRRSLSKLIGSRVEDAKIAVRNVRRDVMKDIDEFESEKWITEDDQHRGQKMVQDLTDKTTDEIDAVGKEKQAEVMEV